MSLIIKSSTPALSYIEPLIVIDCPVLFRSKESGIVQLAVNQNSILRGKGKIVAFSHFLELVKGKNTITIAAEDEAGNKTVKKIIIVREIPKALLLNERLSITVIPFEQKGSISNASLSFQDNIINALSNQNRFRIVERNFLDLILKKEKLSLTKLIDRNTALKLGKHLAAQSIITGSIIETRTGIEIVSRMIDIETSEILASTDVYDEDKDIPALKSLAGRMTAMFHHEFPLVDGIILQKKGGYIFTDLGQDRIKMHRRLIVYREESVMHPVTGKMLGVDYKIIDRARITQTEPVISKAIVSNDKEKDINLQDKVIAE